MLALKIIINPPNLEYLDFWGLLDDLFWSLDDDVWLDAAFFECKGQDSQCSQDSASLSLVADLQANDKQCSHDSSVLQLHYFPGPVFDCQPSRDTATLTVKGWGWIPVPPPKLEQWRQI